MSTTASVSDTSAVSVSHCQTPLAADSSRPLEPADAASKQPDSFKPLARSAQPHAVFDLLCTELPPPPPLYITRTRLEAIAKEMEFDLREASPSKGNTLEGTRSITSEDIQRLNSDYPEDAGLNLVVYERSMLEDVLNEATTLLKNLHVKLSEDDHRDWATRLMPDYTTSNLPAFFASEKDFEQWFAAVLGRPALAVCKVLLNEKRPLNDKLPTRMQAQAVKYPTLTSGYHSDIIPDMLLVRSGEFPLHVVPLAVEVKSTNVLNPQVKKHKKHGNDALSDDGNILYRIQRSFDNVPSGHAIAFRCPSHVDDLVGTKSDHLSHLIVQVREFNSWYGNKS